MYELILLLYLYSMVVYGFFRIFFMVFLWLFMAFFFQLGRNLFDLKISNIIKLYIICRYDR